MMHPSATVQPDPMQLSIDLNIQSGNWPDTAETHAQAAIKAAIAHLELSFDQPAELSILLTDDDTIADLNVKWRQKSGPTNVLSFPQIAPFAPPAGLLGDIVLASQTLASEAETLHIGFTDHYSHLIVHGFLHILGYDHIEADEATRMEGHECAILARLDIADPYSGDFAAS